MKPTAVSQGIAELLKLRAKVLCVIVDDQQRVVDVDGDALHYGFEGVVAGADALDVFPFLLGISETTSTDFAFMETPSGRSAELHWVRIDPQHFSLTLLDVSSARDQVREIQTVANESRILKYRLEQTLEQLEQSRSELSKLAYRDPLTGLSNHRAFHEMFEREVQRALRLGQALSLLVIDVDLFKLYNDCYGHATGDDCLRTVAQCIDALAQSSGHVAGRVGGEEFAMMLPAASLDEATQIGERLCAAVRELRVSHQDSPFGFVTLSVGAASLSPDPAVATARMLYQTADLALYEAKHRGRNRVCTQALGAAAAPRPDRRSPRS